MRRAYQAHPNPPGRRRRRTEITHIVRSSIIKYVYGVHYLMFSMLNGFLYLAGVFEKRTEDDYYMLMGRTQFENVDCSPIMANWFRFYVYFCPIASVSSLILSYLSINNFDVKTYTMETWRKEYRIYTNFNRKINWTILLIEAVNFLWATLGMVFNQVLS